MLFLPLPSYTKHSAQRCCRQEKTKAELISDGTGKVISGSFEVTTEILLGKSRNQSRGESICSSAPAPCRDEEEGGALVLREGGDGAGTALRVSPPPETQPNPEFNGPLREPSHLKHPVALPSMKQKEQHQAPPFCNDCLKCTATN